jgi:hypothetical protein
MEANYFFIDGSALTAQIRQLRRADQTFSGRRLCPLRFVRHLIDALPDLHGRAYKRITFYFPKGDEAAIEDYLLMPDHKRPSEIRDMSFKFCGHKLKKSSEFEKFVEETVPPKFHDRFSKSEKGIDIEICCDALKLASASRIERLFLLSNDGDFIPLCRTLKEFGANISIIHLTEVVPPNGDLLREADSYDVVPRMHLQQMFLPIPTAQPPALAADPAAIVTATADMRTHEMGQVAEQSFDSEKPAAEPSDLKIEPHPAGGTSTEDLAPSAPSGG